MKDSTEWTLEDEMDWAENQVPRTGVEWLEVAIDIGLWCVVALTLAILIKG